MANVSLKDLTISATYDLLMVRNNSWSATGNEISLMNDSGVIQPSNFFIDPTNDRIGLGTSEPDGQLHIYKDNSTQTANAAYDELIIEANTGDSGMSFLCGNGQAQGIAFGDAGNDDIGRIRYDHASNLMSFHANDTLGLTVNTNGTITVPSGATVTAGDMNVNNGNVVIGTSGKGIDFSAATPDESGTGGSTAEVLDDYEEGTWDCRNDNTVAGNSGSGNRYNVVGHYTKIGRMVHAWVHGSDEFSVHLTDSPNWGTLPFIVVSPIGANVYYPWMTVSSNIYVTYWINGGSLWKWQASALTNGTYLMNVNWTYTTTPN